MDTTALGGSTSAVEVRVIPSARRKKSVSAKWVGDAIEVRVPATLSATDRERHVRELTERLLKRRDADLIDLNARAKALAKEYELPLPNSIEWSSRQQKRWGSCTPSTGAIRISDRMSEFPNWVVDHVVLHELAHLVVANHSPAFYALIERYPHAEKAEGFLLAVSLGHAGSLSSSD